jgi:hypothetical protein
MCFLTLSALEKNVSSRFPRIWWVLKTLICWELFYLLTMLARKKWFLIFICFTKISERKLFENDFKFLKRSQNGYQFYIYDNNVIIKLLRCFLLSTNWYDLFFNHILMNLCEFVNKKFYLMYCRTKFRP